MSSPCSRAAACRAASSGARAASQARAPALEKPGQKARPRAVDFGEGLVEPGDAVAGPFELGRGRGDLLVRPGLGGLGGGPGRGRRGHRLMEDRQLEDLAAGLLEPHEPLAGGSQGGAEIAPRVLPAGLGLRADRAAGSRR